MNKKLFGKFVLGELPLFAKSGYLYDSLERVSLGNTLEKIGASNGDKESVVLHPVENSKGGRTPYTLVSCFCVFPGGHRTLSLAQPFPSISSFCPC